MISLAFTIIVLGFGRSVRWSKLSRHVRHVLPRISLDSWGEVLRIAVVSWLLEMLLPSLSPWAMAAAWRAWILKPPIHSMSAFTCRFIDRFHIHHIPSGTIIMEHQHVSWVNQLCLWPFCHLSLPGDLWWTVANSHQLVATKQLWRWSRCVWKVSNRPLASYASKRRRRCSRCSSAWPVFDEVKSRVQGSGYPDLYEGILKSYED